MQTLSALVLFIIGPTLAARAPQRYRMKKVDGPPRKTELSLLYGHADAEERFLLGLRSLRLPSLSHVDFFDRSHQNLD